MAHECLDARQSHIEVLLYQQSSPCISGRKETCVQHGINDVGYVCGIVCTTPTQISGYKLSEKLYGYVLWPPPCFTSQFKFSVQ